MYFVRVTSFYQTWRHCLGVLGSVCRPVKSCGWPWVRQLLYWSRFLMWWCAWTAPLTSASHWDDTTAMPVARSAKEVKDGPLNLEFLCSVKPLHCLFEQVVCRACSRNRYPLKYLKDRVAKVCDHCYAELRKRGESHLWGKWKQKYLDLFVPVPVVWC